MKTRTFARAASGVALALAALGGAAATAVPAAADAANGQYVKKGEWTLAYEGDSIAYCDRGDLVVGGGFDEKDGGHAHDYAYTAPTSDGIGWWAAAGGGKTHKVQVYVLCQKAAK